MRRLSGATLLLLGLSGFVTAEPFRLGAEDRVEVRVFTRPDLSANLRVDGDGNLRLPLVGSVRAAGLTIDELEARLAIAWRDAAGILDPRVTVTVPETGPIFIGGAVQNPGRYNWASDLTAAKAYVLAGGAPRLMENGGPLLAFEAHRTVEQEEQTLSRLAAARLRRARLRAESASAPTFEPPADWPSGLRPSQAAELLDRERQLFARRHDTLNGEINNLTRQSQILTEQKAAFKASLAKKVQQRTLLEQELTAISGDAEIARLVPVTRLLALKRSIVEADNDHREIERRISEAALQSAIAEQAITNLQSSRLMEASSQLAEVERELVALQDSLGPVRRRAEIGRLAIGTAGAHARALTLSYTIRREIDGKVQVLNADADTKLLPRDLLQIVSEQTVSDREQGMNSDSKTVLAPPMAAVQPEAGSSASLAVATSHPAVQRGTPAAERR